MNANKMKVAGQKKEKDRPKSTEKTKGKNKERGTPENKPTTPGLDDDRIGERSSYVLNDDEIQGLAIKQDALNEIRESMTAVVIPQAPRDLKPVNVRKINRNPPPKRVTQSITIAKGAPPRAPLKPVETEGNSGPSFDKNGNVIAHSILGTLEEYKLEAQHKGELSVDYYIREQDRVQTPTALPERYRKSVLVKGETSTQPMAENTEQSNALFHWQEKMRQRKVQQGHLSRLLNKSEDELVMNQVDKFREKQELRYLIDRSIPAVDYGKGYRVGSEFWHQRHLIGDEDLGLHMSLTQTERGYPPPIEHVDVPASIRTEKGMQKRPQSASQGKPWHRSNFLYERISELAPVMKDLDPHKPASDGLEVIGTNNPYQRYIRAATPISERPETPSVNEGDENQDPLSKHPDVYTPPMFGPTIKFAGEMVQWAGDSHSSMDKVAVDARVTFEAFASCRSTSILEIINLGTTAMYFNWKMLPKSNPFDLVNANVQRFYFNTSSGVILPGQTLNFPFVFKSDKAGVFSEQWQFQTHPVVAGGAALVVTLRGVALKEDKLKKHRDLIENKLQKNIIWKHMRRLVDDVVDSIKSPERPKSPIDSYLTEEEIFKRQNPQLHYKHHVVERLRDLYKMLVDPPTMDGDEDDDEADEEQQMAVTWNLNVAEFKRDVLELSDEDERKSSYLETINEAVMQLSFPHMNPRLRKMYRACYHYFSNAVDSIGGHSIQLRNLLGLPEREQEEKLDDSARDEIGISPAASRRMSYQSSATLSAGKKRMSVDQTASSAKRAFRKAIVKMVGVTNLNPAATAVADGGKMTASKSAPKAGAKEEKKSGKAEPKKEAKGKEAAKKSDRASPTKKTPPARAAAVTQSLSQVSGAEGRITPSTTVEPSSTSGVGDVKLEKKYREKMTAQAYAEMEKMIINLTEVFEEIGLSDHATVQS